MRNKGYLYAIIAAISYAIVSVFGKNLLVMGISPTIITMTQYFLTAVLLFSYLWMFQREQLKVSAQSLKRFFLLGIFGGLTTNTLYFYTMHYLNAGLATMLLFSSPVLIVLYYALSGQKRIRLVNWLAVALASVGNLLALNILSDTQKFSALGILLGLLSAAFYAFYNIFMESKLPDQNPHVLNAYASLSAFAASFVINVVTQPAGFRLPLASLPWLLLLTLFSNIFALYFFYHAIHLIGAEKASVVSTMELPFTLTVAYFFLHETMNGGQLIGVSLVVLSILMLRKFDGGAHESAKDECHAQTGQSEDRL